MATPKKFVNDPAAAVVEMIEGLVETYPHLQYLDGLPEIKVVLRADIKQGAYDKVALISGGGSGHEPAHAGFVGKGMLTAAVCGEIFASPSVNAILMAIRAVTGPSGCLLIVKNYTGDRLNFGLAAEKAKAEGFKVEMVIVADDCSIPSPLTSVGKRGLAGTLFVHKVAGSMAEEGNSLADVSKEASRISKLIGTMGVGLSLGAIPGSIHTDRIGLSKMEMGIGIHGEAGVSIVDIQPVDSIISHILNRIIVEEGPNLSIKRGNRVALLMNSLGSTTNMELMIANSNAIAKLQIEYGLSVERIYSGCLLSSLDMAGLSLSILKIDDSILPHLDSSTSAPAWPKGNNGPRCSTRVPLALPIPLKNTIKSERPAQLNKHGRLIDHAIREAANAVLDLAQKLNEWDSIVGDGDCGSTLGKGAKAILEDLNKFYNVNDVLSTSNEICKSIQRSMGGTSGVLYDIFFSAAQAKLKEFNQPSITPKQWSETFDSAVNAVKRYGGASEGFRTMLDALIPASKTFQQKLNEGVSAESAFLFASEAASSGAESTREMHAQAGRSCYVPHDVLGSAPDPGAMAAAAWLRGIVVAIHVA